MPQAYKQVSGSSVSSRARLEFTADSSIVAATVVASSRGDVLVGADGIHSTGRSFLFPNEGPPHWSGITMWRGATEWPEFGGGSSMIIAGGVNAKLVLYPIAQGSSPRTRLTTGLADA